MKHNKRFILVAALVLLATLLIAGAAMADPLKTISFAPTSLEVKMDSGLNKAVLVDATDAAALVKPTIDPATPDPYWLEYAVDDADVAYISTSWWDEVHCVVTSKKPGTVKVTVKAYSQANNEFITQSSFSITFVEVPFSAVKVNDPGDLSVKQWQYLDLAAYVAVEAPATGATYNKDNGLIWTVDNQTIAEVTSSGEVYGKKAGTAKITVKAKGNPDAKGEFTVVVTENSIKKLTVEPATLTLNMYEIGYFLTVTKEPSSAPADYKYTSSDPQIVKVDSDGEIYAKKAGTATIRVASAADASIYGECVITVVDNSLTALSFSQTAITLNLNDGGLDLNEYLTRTPATGATNGVVWTSSDVTVARVDSGVVYPQKPGTVTITAASSKDPTIKAEATITIEAVNATAVAFTQSAIELEQGSGTFYPADMLKVAPADASAKDITFSTSDRDCVTLDGDFGSGYTANPAKVGTSTITVTWKNWDDTVVTGTMTVTVKAPKIESFGFAKTEYSLTTTSKDLNLWRRLVIKPDNRKWLSVFPDDPDYLIWDSSDATIAEVYSDGSVRPVAPGTAEISVTYAHDETVTAKVTVTVTGTPVKKIALNRTKIEFSPYDTAKSGELKLSYQPANADIKEIYWTISDPTIAWLSGSPVANSTSSGVYDTKYLEVYPNENGKTGTTTITVFVDDGQTVHEATCEVSVAYPKADISLENAKVTLSLVKDKTYASNNQYSFYAWNTLLNNNPDDYEDEIDARSFKWASSDKSVAKISKNGKITVLKKGKTTITGTYKKDASITVTCEVTVTQTKIKSISAIDRTIRVGQVIDLFGGKSSEGGDGWIVLLPKTTNTVRLFNPELKITSSKKAVVSIKNGKLSGLKPGTSKITVKAQDGSKKKTTFKVTVIANTDVEFPEK